MTDPTTIPILHRGDRITAAHYGAVTDAVRRFDIPRYGTNDNSGSAQFPNPVFAPSVYVISSVDIPQYSVFQLQLVSTGPTVDTPATVYDAGPVAVNSVFPRIFLTNSDVDLTAGVPGHATVITQFYPVRVLGLAAFPPFVFKQCGAEALQVSNRATGLLCLANYNDPFVDVIAWEPPFYRAKSSTAVTSGSYTSPTSFKADAWLPDPTSDSPALVKAIDPALLDLTVWNYDTCFSGNSGGSGSGGSSSGVGSLTDCKIAPAWNNLWQCLDYNGCLQVVTDVRCDSGDLVVQKQQVRR